MIMSVSTVTHLFSCVFYFLPHMSLDLGRPFFFNFLHNHCLCTVIILHSIYFYYLFLGVSLALTSPPLRDLFGFFGVTASCNLSILHSFYACTYFNLEPQKIGGNPRK